MTAPPPSDPDTAVPRGVFLTFPVAFLTYVTASLTGNILSYFVAATFVAASEFLFGRKWAAPPECLLISLGGIFADIGFVAFAVYFCRRALRDAKAYVKEDHAVEDGDVVLWRF